MTTFQAIIYGIAAGFGEFLPISAGAHLQLLGYVTGWPVPAGVLSGGFAFASLLAVLVYFRHDWASMISCFLQVLIFRKRPMTLDERLPLFLLLTSLPTAVGWYYLRDLIGDIEWSPLLVAGSTAAFGLPLLFAESMSKKNKGMFDWRIVDTLTVGITQMAMLIPGCGQLAGALPGALIRNFNHEAACKYVFFATAPALAFVTFLRLHDLQIHSAMPAEGTTWLSFSVAILVTFFASLLAIGGFMKQIQRKSLKQYVVYRILLAVAIGLLYWLRNRG